MLVLHCCALHLLSQTAAPFWQSESGPVIFHTATFLDIRDITQMAFLSYEWLCDSSHLLSRHSKPASLSRGKALDRALQATWRVLQDEDTGLSATIEQKVKLLAPMWLRL